ncbi:MAG TPA: D-tyrosyl-tRNA(Tyr) deacylase [Verrucomicrobia bacterium]|nr:D-tyrosyl-tRNA(Tyr) deacylase [Verrucomicrobiota bacterium]
MKLLIQRAAHGSVSVDGEVLGRIHQGLVILVGVRSGDGVADAVALARKTAMLRIFVDGEGRMNRSVLDIGGEALVISQFTLYADTRKGNRPSFIRAAEPSLANDLYLAYIAALAEQIGKDRVQTGRFGADMQVELLNDGPVTIELSSDP